MNKKVLILATSLRRGSNSSVLAEEFARGAREAGNEVELLSLENRQIGFCRGCLACQKTMRCVIRDDANEVLEAMLAADVVAFATPIYFYEMSGQMKTMLDRTNPAFPAEYRFRDIYLLATAADEDESAMDGAIQGLEGWIRCFDGVRLVGVVKGTGIDAPNAAQENKQVLETAYRTGRSV